MDHIKIDVIDGEVGPWVHLYCPINKVINGRDPLSFIWGMPPVAVTVHDQIFEAYDGPLPESEEYQACTAAYRPMMHE
jgi:hypothetical protein